MAKKKTERKIGRSVFGLRAPIIREGDDVEKIATETLLDCGIPIKDRGILCITESVVARAAGLYATVNEIAADVRSKFVENDGRFDRLVLWFPIYSRNRFAMCLKGIARAMDKGGRMCIVLGETDEVGNKVVNQVTGTDIIKYYSEICESEGVTAYFFGADSPYMTMIPKLMRHENHLVCPVRDNVKIMEDIDIFRTDIDDDAYRICSLLDILSSKSEWGLYGSNKASEEMIKLFPPTDICQKLVDGIQARVKEATGKTIEVGVYGDGGFKDPDSGIYEELDPVIMVAYTSGLDGMPSEVKIKNLADDKYKDLSGDDLVKALKKEAKEAGDTSGKMISMGCTPRKLTNLIGSAADLISGSGSQGCPFVYFDGYFSDFSSE